MVRALLAGRKTQTRRVLKPQPLAWVARVIDITEPFFCDDEQQWGQVETIWNRNSAMWEPENEVWRPLKLPYAVGDRLYVREAFSYDTLDVDRDGALRPWYWADGNMADADQGSGNFTKPKPSIHMPRWASRLTLTVTDVRVQRLQAISADDCRAEGHPKSEGDYPLATSNARLCCATGVMPPEWQECHQLKELSPSSGPNSAQRRVGP